MPSFDIETKEIIAFDARDTYISNTYFDKNQLFKRLRTYYNEDKYQFGIPHEYLGKVRQVLDIYYYELSGSDNPKDYSVVVSKETDSSDMLRNSVMRKHRGQHELLVMKDELSKEQVIEQGAVSLEEAGVNKKNLEWEISMTVTEALGKPSLWMDGHLQVSSAQEH